MNEITVVSFTRDKLGKQYSSLVLDSALITLIQLFSKVKMCLNLVEMKDWKAYSLHQALPRRSASI